MSRVFMLLINRFLLGFVCMAFIGCARPVDQLISIDKIALVKVVYDPTIYMFSADNGFKKDVIFTKFSGDATQRRFHEYSLNEFLINLMSTTVKQMDVMIVRPLKLVDTSLMQDLDVNLQYEYLLEPYDPIDINNAPFMVGLANRINVDAVMEVKIQFGILVDETDVWQDKLDDPLISGSYSQLVRDTHNTSQLRTQITITVVDSLANQIYLETRFVDVDTDTISIESEDLEFSGGVSPKLIDLGLEAWIDDWSLYLNYLDD